MKVLLLIGGFAYLTVLGFWIMDKIDRFLDSGKISPYWNAEEERAAATPEKEPPSARGSAISHLKTARQPRRGYTRKK